MSEIAIESDTKIASIFFSGHIKLKRSQSAISADDEDVDETPLFSPSPSESESEDGALDISMYRSINSGNLGRSLLLKMGWREGTGLGIGGFGRVDPIPISDKRGGDLTGIGKLSLDTRAIAYSTANRRTLESETQVNETEAERDLRITLTEKKQAQKDDVIQALKTYRCDLCQKQYDRPSTYEAHLNSYDHHHKKRFLEMKQTQKGKTEAIGAMEKKREREKKREEREIMAKMAEAAGIKLGTLPATGPPVPLQAVPKVGTSSGGWKKVAAKPSSAFTSDQPVVESSKSAGWKTVTTASPWKPKLKSSPVASALYSSGVDTSETIREAHRKLLPSSTDASPPPESKPPPLPS